VCLAGGGSERCVQRVTGPNSPNIHHRPNGRRYSPIRPRARVPRRSSIKLQYTHLWGVEGGDERLDITLGEG
jgi:hypothetical protein